MLETNFPLDTSATREAIVNFWGVFKKNEDDFNLIFSAHSKHDFNVAKFMHTYFAAISPNLNWEFGPGQNKEHVLAIAPERNRSFEPLARLIVVMAPECADFEFQVDRGFTPWGSYKDMQDGRLKWEGPEGIMFSIAHGKHNMFDLVFYVPPSLKSAQISGYCFVAAESLLGEAVFAKWIHYFDVEDLPKSGLFSRFKKTTTPDILPLSKLRETVAVYIADIKNKLPERPLHETAENASWSLMEMKPEKQDDYTPLGDLLVSPTCSIDIFEAFYSGRKRFHSERFSKCGEHFIFVQIDGTAVDLNQEIFDDRGAIENAINGVLEPLNIGGQIGGGTGLRYSYIFLSVTDLEQAVPLIRKALQKGKLTRRSWILFNDTHREQEWIGIWDDSPAPKLPVVKA